MQVIIRTLADLEKFEAGVVAKTFERDLQILLSDLRDRVTVRKPRSLTLKIDLVPVAGDAGELAEVKIDVAIATSMPTNKTRTVSARAIGVTAIAYDDLSPDDVQQMTIDDELERTGS